MQPNTEIALESSVRGGTIVTPDGRVRADVGIRDGKVVALAETLRAANEIDARGLLVLPGLLDAHVHLRDPGMTYKEDFGTGTRAAAVGGVTTVFDMPNTLPPVATAEGFADKLATVTPKAHIDFGLYGMLGQSNVDEIEKIAALGAVGLKLFMGQTTGDNPCPDDGAIFAGLREAKDAGLVVGVHAENNPLLQQLGRELRALGRTDARAHLESRPELVEVEAVTRISTLADAAGAALHIHHLSTGAGLARVKVLRALGHRVTVEAVIGHLLLNDDAYDTFGNLVKLNPPIRPQSDVDALWVGVGRGDVDIIATDHAPHSLDEQHECDVWRAPGGWIGVETLLPLLLTSAAAGRLTVSDIVRLCAYNPARIWRVENCKGSLQVGADADIVLVDEHAADTIDASKLHSKHPITPFDGEPTVGRVVATYLRGKLVAAEGQPVGDPLGAQIAPTAVGASA